MSTSLTPPHQSPSLASSSSSAPFLRRPPRLPPWRRRLLRSTWRRLGSCWSFRGALELFLFHYLIIITVLFNLTLTAVVHPFGPTMESRLLQLCGGGWAGMPWPVIALVDQVPLQLSRSLEPLVVFVQVFLLFFILLLIDCLHTPIYSPTQNCMRLRCCWAA